MQTELHMINGIAIAEVTGGDIVLHTPQDVLELFGSLYGEEHVHAVVLHEANLPPEFFQLRTGLAGEILQKFVNYRIKLAIVGSFDKYAGKALADFIYECNKGRQIFFVGTRGEAFERLTAG